MEGFTKSLNKVHCAIGMLTILDALESDGHIRPSKVASLKLTKPLMWSYVYYLQHYNRTKPAFASLGKAKKLSDEALVKLVLSIKPSPPTLLPSIKSVTKKDIAAFIAVAAKEGLNIPFIKKAAQQAVKLDSVADAIERQIDLEFHPTLLPGNLDNNDGNVNVRMEITMEPLSKPSSRKR